MTEKILLVDDERDIANLLEEVLRKEGFDHIWKAFHGQDAIRICKEQKPEVVILDIMLPDFDGIEVCKKIREFSHCSILFLSSKNDDVDKILGLSSGGDDYITKPFSPKEVVFRVKSQLRRQQYAREEVDHQKKAMLMAGEIRVDTDACIAYRNDKMLELTAKEYGLLCYLIENHDKVISKERLYEQVWGEDSVVCDNTIMVHIRHLREKIEDDASVPKRLLTVKGLGYRFVGEQA